MLLDSNIIIYSFLPEFQNIQAVVSKYDTCCSAISYVETLGYHKLSEDEKHYLQRLFGIISILPITQAIISTAVGIRQQRKMSLGDAIVAATALEHCQTLVQHGGNLNATYKLNLYQQAVFLIQEMVS